MSEVGIFERSDVALHPSPDGIRDLAVLSPALGRRGDVSVFVPVAHRDASGLPIVILLHGVFGSHWAWARSGNAHRTLNRLVDAGEIQPMILAMPSDGLFGVGSGYLAREGEDAERWICDEVPEAVKLVMPTADTDNVSIAGLSMGGWGALRLAARRPHRFRAASGMSPLTRLAHVSAYAPERMRAIHEPAIDDSDLGELLVSSKGHLPPIRVSCGTGDELINPVRALRDRLDEADVPHEYAEAPGAHEWGVWAEELALTLRFINRHSGPQPT